MTESTFGVRGRRGRAEFVCTGNPVRVDFYFETDTLPFSSETWSRTEAAIEGARMDKTGERGRIPAKLDWTEAEIRHFGQVLQSYGETGGPPHGKTNARVSPWRLWGLLWGVYACLGLYGAVALSRIYKHMQLKTGAHNWFA